MLLLLDTWSRFRAHFFARGEEGASLVEYALLLALIALVCIVGIQFLGTSTSSRFSSVGSAVNP
jgi:pilus assembly protein Flp/PilA